MEVLKCLFLTVIIPIQCDNNDSPLESLYIHFIDKEEIVILRRSWPSPISSRQLPRCLLPCSVVLQPQQDSLLRNNCFSYSNIPCWPPWGHGPQTLLKTDREIFISDYFENVSEYRTLSRKVFCAYLLGQ